jgi:hypothetical protein
MFVSTFKIGQSIALPNVRKIGKSKKKSANLVTLLTDEIDDAVDLVGGVLLDAKLLRSILRISISAENFSEKFLKFWTKFPFKNSG